jgi:hypothetical protein
MPARDSLDFLKRTSLGQPATEPAQGADPETLTISEMDGRYAGIHPSDRRLTRLHVIHEDGRVESLQYHHIDAKSEFHGGSFVFLFSGAKLWEMTVEGRNLWRMYDHISLCRWPYIRVATRDFDEQGEVVTAVRIKEIVIREPA